eukprot:2620798-Lingulodinium_polyedra.AAC.1
MQGNEVITQVPLVPAIVYNAYHHAREVKHFGAEWSNDSLPTVRHIVNRAYDVLTDRIHYFAPVRD